MKMEAEMENGGIQQDSVIWSRNDAEGDIDINETEQVRAERFLIDDILEISKSEGNNPIWFSCQTNVS